MPDGNCSGYSTVAPGRPQGKTCANFFNVGKKLRIQTGIHTVSLTHRFRRDLASDC